MRGRRGNSNEAVSVVSPVLPFQQPKEAIAHTGARLVLIALAVLAFYFSYLCKKKCP